MKVCFPIAVALLVCIAVTPSSYASVGPVEAAATIVLKGVNTWSVSSFTFDSTATPFNVTESVSSSAGSLGASIRATCSLTNTSASYSSHLTATLTSTTPKTIVEWSLKMFANGDSPYLSGLAESSAKYSIGISAEGSVSGVDEYTATPVGPTTLQEVFDTPKTSVTIPNATFSSYFALYAKAKR